MAAALESRLQAAKNVLEGLGSADGATKARASSVHRSALVAMLKPMLSGLSDTNKADLTTMVNGIGGWRRWPIHLQTSPSRCHTLVIPGEPSADAGLQVLPCVFH